ncbi:MOSC domain-containing protein [Clostridium transplantifaecale]|uniref:MOSC domain-containing protein n=1 Tax=Clostridium transplantifaecale TaxID=2479838 RepID=UPI000F63881E|nr:MOSC domain-containing protein [Clostridium transplantifaecale]
MGNIKAICISEKKGTEKHPVPYCDLVRDYGISGDAHAGSWHRQVSLLSAERVREFNEKGGGVSDGDFGENLLVEGLDFSCFAVGTTLTAGDAVLEITQLGKECHHHCTIYHRVGECIMPKRGVFARVLKGGRLYPGDEIVSCPPDPKRPFTAAVITLSDKGSRGERVDESGPAAAGLLADAGYRLVESILIPDEPEELKTHLKRLSDSRQVSLILTLGGTGFSPRDTTPEATMAVAERNAPGIAEAIRNLSMQVTKRAMLSRGVSVIRGKTLIVNLPGSPKAVRESIGFIIEELPHGLDILRGGASECAR